MRYLSVLVALAACGGSSATKAPAAATPRAAGSDNVCDPAPSLPPLELEQCEALLDHVIQIAFEAEREDRPIEVRPTEADLVRARGQLRQELLDSCVGASAETFAYQCAMDAEDVATVEACLGSE